MDQPLPAPPHYIDQLKAQSADEIALDIIGELEIIRAKMNALRSLKVFWPEVPASKQFDPRALSVALTELETAQLWLANSRPD